MSGFVVARDRHDSQIARRVSGWERYYLRRAGPADVACAIVGVFAAVQLRFGNNVTGAYIALSLALPVLWICALWLAGGYDVRFLGVGSDEYRKVLSAGVGLTAAIAVFSYAINLEVSRSYVLIALPTTTLLGLISRFTIRKQLVRQRAAGRYLLSVVAVGHEAAVADLVKELGRDRYHGLTVVGACVAHPSECDEVSGVPVYGDLDDVTAAVQAFGADTVAVAACPEMDGIRLRSLAWELEKTGTDLCVSPALLDVAGPRTTIRPTAGLTLLHVDHPQLSGFRVVIKDLFDRCVAAAALILLFPLLAVLGATIWLHDRGPALFTQTRVGKDGQVFRIYKFRTMVVDAEQRRAESARRATTRRHLVQAPQGSTGHGGRSTSAALVGRRAAAAAECIPRPHVTGGAAPGAAGRGGQVRRACPAQAGGEAGPDRTLAGERAIGSELGGVGAARPAVRGELVVRARSADPMENDFGSGAAVRRLLAGICR